MNNELTFLNDAVMVLEQIDYSSLVNSLSPMVLLYATNKFYQNYKMQKEVKPKYIKIKEFNNKLKNNKNIDYQKIATKEYNYAIYEFIKRIKNKIPVENLTNFYNNINSIKIKNKKPIFINHSILADYDTKKNQIRVFKKESYTVIYHELLHMASSCYKDGVRYSGFKQTTLNNSIGEGINEGYTQLLTERYFGHVNELPGIYEYQMFMASNLEKIIEKNKMEQLYFNSNLNGLIKELLNYASKDEIIKFIINIDFVNAHLKDKNPYVIEKNILANSFRYNHQFLFKTYANKLKQEYDNGLIDQEQMKEKLIKYTNPLGLSIKIGNNRYLTLSVDYISSVLDEVLNKDKKL